MDERQQEALPVTAEAEQPVPREFSKGESGYAWVCVLLGYLLCRALPIAVYPLGGFCTILLLFAVTAAVLKKRQAPFGATSLIAAGSGLAMSAALLVSANAFLHTLAYGYTIAAYFCFVYTACGNGEALFSKRAWVTWCQAMLAPFYAVTLLPRALFSHRMKNGGKFLGKAVAGAAIAIVPTLIVVGLLSYDSAFCDVLEEVLQWDLSAIGSHIGSVILGIPVGMVLFGAVTASCDHCGDDLFDEDICRKITLSARAVSAVTVTAATLPLLAVYVLFFFSQLPYYLSAFTGELPQGFCVADYAREGFFQLCTVAVINFAVIVLANVVMKRRDDRVPVMLRLLTVLYTASTLVLIATALAKMMLYIDTYGLTQKRVYATWFMAVLAVLFVLVAIKMFAARMKVFVWSGVIVVVAFAALSLSNVDGMIASYNVDRYLDGSLETVDVAAMEELGEAAIPSLARLQEALDGANGNAEQRLRREATAAMRRYAMNTEETSVFTWNIPAIRAEQALRKAGLR